MGIINDIASLTKHLRLHQVRISKYRNALPHIFHVRTQGITGNPVIISRETKFTRSTKFLCRALNLGTVVSNKVRLKLKQLLQPHPTIQPIPVPVLYTCKHHRYLRSVRIKTISYDHNDTHLNLLNIAGISCNHEAGENFSISLFEKFQCSLVLSNTQVLPTVAARY